MARLADIRAAIVSDEAATEEDDTSTDGVTDDWSFDDDDFWDGLDLMETSYNMLKSLITHCRMAPGRKRLLENHMADLKQFVDQFPAIEGESTDELGAD